MSKFTYEAREILAETLDHQERTRRDLGARRDSYHRLAELLRDRTQTLKSVRDYCITAMAFANEQAEHRAECESLWVAIEEPLLVWAAYKAMFLYLSTYVEEQHGS